MKKCICFIVFTLCLCQLGLAQQKHRFGQLKRVKDSVYVVDDGKQYVADRNVVTVKLKSGQSKIKKDVKILRSNKLGYIDISVPENVDVENYVSELEETGEFDVVEYNSIGEYAVLSNDTRINEQWYLNSINAFSAWDITMGKSSIIVAILDSGTDWEHPDIGSGTDGYSNVDKNLGWNYSTNNTNVITLNEHGTIVAGIIGAKTNNLRGIGGITGGNQSSGVTIMPMCIGVSAPNSAILDDAIIDAVDNGAKVIQLSLSAQRTNPIEDAIAYAIQNNVTIVCCSHNQGLPTVTYPASHPDVIAVGAIDKNNRRASFSNYGNDLDVVAPGVNILSTTLNNDYISQDGTSFAAPIVSGVAALILSIRPDLSQAQVRQAIESTCTKLPGYTYAGNSAHPNGTWESETGHGLVNAYGAVKSVIPVLTVPDIACAGSTVTFNTNLSAGATVTWNVPSAYFTPVSISNTAATYTVGTASSTSVTVSVSASVGGNHVVTLQKTLKVNPPNTGSGTISGSSSVACGYTEGYCTSLLSGGCTPLRYEWLLDGDLVSNSACVSIQSVSRPPSKTAAAGIEQSDDGSPILRYPQPGRITNCVLTLYVKNSSGGIISSDSKRVQVCNYPRAIGAVQRNAQNTKSGSHTVSIYPNPATDAVNVEIQSDVLTAGRAAAPLYTVQLWHEQRGLLRSVESASPSTQLSLAGLPAGMYMVHVLTGGETVSRQIIWKQ